MEVGTEKGDAENTKQVFIPKVKSNNKGHGTSSRKKMKLSEPEPNSSTKSSSREEITTSVSTQAASQKCDSETKPEYVETESTLGDIENINLLYSESNLKEYGLSIEPETLESTSQYVEETILPLEPEIIWQNGDIKEMVSWEQEQNGAIDILSSEVTRREYGVVIETETSEEILPLESSDTKTVTEHEEGAEETEDTPCWQGSILKVESLANDTSWDETEGETVASEATWVEDGTNEEMEASSFIETSEDAWRENCEEIEVESNMEPSSWQDGGSDGEVEAEETQIGPCDDAWRDNEDEEGVVAGEWPQENSEEEEEDIKVVCCEPEVGALWWHRDEAEDDSQSTLPENELDGRVYEPPLQQGGDPTKDAGSETQGTSSPHASCKPSSGSGKSFVCPFCLQTFSSATKCQLHVHRLHPNAKKKPNHPRRKQKPKSRPGEVSCEFCAELFPKDSLAQHILDEHRNQCKKCNKVFVSVKEWCRHDIKCNFTKENLEFEKKCNHCPILVNETSIKYHVFWNHYYPKLCKSQKTVFKITPQTKELMVNLNNEITLKASNENHLEIDDIGIIYCCVELKKNLEENAGKQFIVHCSVCSAEFSDEYYFKHHLPICYKSKHFHCPFCSAQKSHLLKNNFLDHMKRHFYLSKKVSGCSECGQYFFTDLNKFSHKGKFHPDTILDNF